jgi:hypothetical protein
LVKGLRFTEVLLDIDGREDMKHIYGIIAVGEKVRPGRDVKYTWVDMTKKIRQLELTI